ncbi:MAG TPA: hypothetical protein VD971_04835 [Phycisphaerales bacterium]|nr:hypothetical protein [Phycisphaerales bacterium]
MTTTHARGAGAIAGAVLLTLCAAGARPSHAQESMYTAAATMPSPTVAIVRPQFHLFEYGINPNDTDERRSQVYEASLGFAYGLARDWALYLEAPMSIEREDLANGETETDKGVEDIDAMVKWRFYKNDTGGVNTARAALMVGARVASGDDEDYSSGSVNPHAGVVLTNVVGRHGFNNELHFTWNTGGQRENNVGGEGPDDAIAFNTSYVYRIIPTRFTSATEGAWYVTAELNNLYETNGDFETRFSPGLMYEGRMWAFEVMGQVPVISELDERPELHYAIGFGFRFTF